MEELKKLEEKIAEIKVKQRNLIDELRKDFSPIFKSLFEKSNGKIESIGWTQYTDYFNDGEETTFSVHADYMYINDENEDDIDELQDEIYILVTEENFDEVTAWNIAKRRTWITPEIGKNNYIGNKDRDDDLISLVAEFKSIIQSIEEELMKDLFGDHVKVTIHSSGEITTREYEHD